VIASRRIRRAFSPRIASMIGRYVLILFSVFVMLLERDTVVLPAAAAVEFSALNVIFVRGTVPLAAANSLDAVFGSTRERSWTYGFPMCPDESKSPKS